MTSNISTDLASQLEAIAVDAQSRDRPAIYQAAKALRRAARIEISARTLLSLVEAKGQPHDDPENVALLEAGDTIAVNEGNLWSLLAEVNS